MADRSSTLSAASGEEDGPSDLQASRLDFWVWFPGPKGSVGLEYVISSPVNNIHQMRIIQELTGA